MKYDAENITYKWTGTILEPANDKTKFFDEALPTNFILELDNAMLAKGLLSIPFLNSDDSPSFSAYSYFRDNVRNVLTNKTNIPEELIIDAYKGNYKRGEELAFLLRFYLEAIRQNEKTGKGPNVTKTITRSEISFFVGEMIEYLIGEDKPELLSLFRSLLNLDKAQNKIEIKTSDNRKKDKAFELKVEHPELSIQKIAALIGVDRSTASKWFSADDAEELLLQTRYSPWRIYRYWVKNENLSIEEIASNLGIEADHLLELKNNKYHPRRWKLHSATKESIDKAINQI